MDNTGLNEKTITAIQNVLAHHPCVEEGILYGSRALGRHRNGSDIDLTLKGKPPLADQLNAIILELDELMLPYQIDLSVFDEIENPDLVDHIMRVGRPLYVKGF
ncbi:MAG: nucleotidyltransferase domain-containing protein [Hahellaceae bacterium]|nr:nucleotidyltransferase domain-containing protein [Hahellaceae bacterium]